MVGIDRTGKRAGAGGEFAKQAVLWASPTAELFGDAESAESFLARREELRAKKTNGNGMGMLLTVQSVMWASPTTRDHKDAGSPSLAVETNHLLGRQAPRMTEDGKWFSPATPGSRLRYRLNWRFVGWLMGIPCSLITPTVSTD